MTDHERKTSHLLGKAFGIGLHRYDPARFPGAVFLDVADAQYNPLDPQEIIAGIHPAARPGKYGLAKFAGNEIVAEVLTSYPWGSDLEFYTDAGEGLVYMATGSSVVEIRSLKDLEFQRQLAVPVRGVTSVALDSHARLWLLSNPLRDGDGGIYVVDDLDRPHQTHKVRQYAIPTSLDSMRITPWGNKLLVADYGSHRVECIGEDGETLGTLYFPYVSGVKWAPDERVLISSGKYGKHTFLLLVTGALHNRVTSGWFGYVMDYATQASNRADAFYLDKVLTQWYLGFSELSLPLPKRAPYMIRVGSGDFREGQAVTEQGFKEFTPILIFSSGHIVASPSDVELHLEVMVPYHHMIAPAADLTWERVRRFTGTCAVDMPGVYRVVTTTESTVDVYAVCKP